MHKTYVRFFPKFSPFFLFLLFLLFLPFLLILLILVFPTTLFLVAITGIEVAKTNTSFLALFF